MSSFSLKTLFRTPKIQLAIVLFFIYVTAIWNSHSFYPLVSLGVSLLFTVFFDLLFLKIRKINIFLPSAAIVSGFIIALLTPPTAPVYEFMLIAGLTMLSKHFLHFHGRHIFNPAGFGLFFTSLLFNQNVSWWAVSWEQFSFINVHFFLILLSPFLISALRMKKYYMQLSFFATLIAMRLLLHFELSISTLLDPTLLFFATVMLPEPITTPQAKTRQIFFGMCVALISLSDILFRLSIPDMLIFSLLINNLLFRLREK